MSGFRSLICSFLGATSGKQRKSSAPFYKTYPYRGLVRLGSVDRRAVVDFDSGFFFNRIPKAGNTTIMNNLAKLKGVHESPSDEILRSLFPMTPAQLSAEELGRFGQLYKFTFVRNPYTRVLSAYLDKIAKPGPRRDKMDGKDGEAPSFGEFVRWLDQDGLYEDIHWAPQSSILVIPVNEFDFVGKLERLEEDFRKVLEHLSPGYQGDDEVVRTYAPHSTGASDRQSEYYTDDLRETVARLYREDFELFGYRT